MATTMGAGAGRTWSTYKISPFSRLVQTENSDIQYHREEVLEKYTSSFTQFGNYYWFLKSLSSHVS